MSYSQCVSALYQFKYFFFFFLFQLSLQSHLNLTWSRLKVKSSSFSVILWYDDDQIWFDVYIFFSKEISILVTANHVLYDKSKNKLEMFLNENLGNRGLYFGWLFYRYTSLFILMFLLRFVHIFLAVKEPNQYIES